MNTTKNTSLAENNSTSGQGGYDVQQASSDFIGRRLPGAAISAVSVPNLMQEAFVAGAAWAEEQEKVKSAHAWAYKRGYSEAEKVADAAVMRKLDGIVDALAGLNGTVGRAIINNGNNFELLSDRVSFVSKQVSDNWQRADHAVACIIDVGQKVEAVLTQVTGGPDRDPVAEASDHVTDLRDLPHTGRVFVGIDTAVGKDETAYAIAIDGKLHEVAPEVYYEWCGLKNMEQDFAYMKEEIIRKHLRS